MGLYFRRSVRVGPLRFNFSGSGIGVSTGIPGLRIGTGPRGAYVHMGAGGLYYRHALGRSNRTSAHRGSTDWPTAEPQPAPELGSATVDPLQSIDSAPVAGLSDSSSQALLQEIQRRQGLHRLGPWVVGLVAGVGIALWSTNIRGVPFFAVLLVGVLAFCWASAHDAIRRTMVVSYDLDAEAAKTYEDLMNAMTTLGQVGGLWHVGAEGQVRDRKYHAGAASIVKRNPTRPRVGQSPILRANLDVPSLNVGAQHLYFFPDRLLVLEGSQVGAIGYDLLRIDVGTTRFIEDGSVPADAQVVDRTWRYVNKKGGPDRRFSDNRELPVVLYETIHFQSSTGLNELLHASRIGVGSPIAVAVARIAILSHAATEPGEVAAEPDITTTSPKIVPDSPPTFSAFSNKSSLDFSNPTVSAENFSRLRRGQTADVIAERDRAWEYRTFALALIDVMGEPPAVAVPSMPTNLNTNSQASAWAFEQLKFPQQMCATLTRLINTELKVAVGPPRKPGDPDAILKVAWEIGREAASARAWATAVWTTMVPERFVPLREQIARIMDQPLQVLSDYGPEILGSIEKALAAPKGGPPQTINIGLAFTMPNQDELLRAIQSALAD
jgi:hypothetical protein